jgi:tRNA (guanine37-N1)-methyltransferase
VILTQHQAEPTYVSLTLDHTLLTYEEILAQLLPDGMVVPVAFERVGHIARYALKPEHLPHKADIGAVCMLKNGGVRTVINKTGEITNEFRVFPMEVIAGVNDTMATLREHGNAFRFDYSKVYWNSRLDTEHARVATIVPAKTRVWDMFCGVGPFAIPLMKKQCIVYANDLNPASVQYLRESANLNKFNKNNLSVYNQDAVQFIRDRGQAVLSGKEQMAERVLMNLPALGLEFLHVFQGLFADADAQQKARIQEMKLPLCLSYCFAPDSKEYKPHIFGRIKKALGDFDSTQVSMHHVRSVAPNKEMYCVTIQLTHEIVFRRKEETVASSSSSKKRPSPTTASDDAIVHKKSKISTAK